MHTLGLTFVKEEQKNIEALNALNNDPTRDDYLNDWSLKPKQYLFAYAPDSAVRNHLDPFVYGRYQTEFEDSSEDVEKKYADLSEEEKEKYPTIHDYASDDYEIAYDENGNERYGHYFNPNGKYDYWNIGNVWVNNLKGKNGKYNTVLPFDDVDWDWNDLFNGQDYPSPFWFVDTNGEWRDADCFNDLADWSKLFLSYIESLKSLPDAERKDIVVYTVYGRSNWRPIGCQPLTNMYSI